MLGATEVRRLLDTHGLSARRALGQHFVVDPGVVRRIAALSGVGPDRPAVEVGPGLGSLTLALAATGAEVVAVEKDTTIVPVLEEVLTQRLGPGHPGVSVVTADALEVDWTRLLGASTPPTWTLVANLPYNVAVPVVLDVLARAPTVGRLVVMVQREVADRLVAEPGGRDIGLPTVKVAWYGRARMLMTVPPEVFLPRPRVASAVVSIDRREPPSDRVESGAVFDLAERAYRHRRKMLRATLGPHLPVGAFARSGVEPTARPEELDVGDWARLAEAAAGGA
jgi:16S rRNA (adenine1518-N6/adenine1519-N6)-dimethyltransferase